MLLLLAMAVAGTVQAADTNRPNILLITSRNLIPLRNWR
jgi:hypothetical protein